MITDDDTRRSSQRLSYKRCLIFNNVFHLLHLIPYWYLRTFRILSEQNFISLGASLISSSVGPIGLRGESDGVITQKCVLQCELAAVQDVLRRTQTEIYIVLGRKQLCSDRTQDSSTFSLEQATKVHRGSRGVALLFP